MSQVSYIADLISSGRIVTTDWLRSHGVRNPTARLSDYRKTHGKLDALRFKDVNGVEVYGFFDYGKVNSELYASALASGARLVAPAPALKVVAA